MAHYDGMREATNAGNESLREAEEVSRARRKAMDDVAHRGRSTTAEEVVEWLADLQDHGALRTNRDAYILSSARAVIKRLSKELQQRDRFLDQRIDHLTHRIEHTRDGSYHHEDLREQRDELTVIKTENKRLQEHLNKAQ